MYASLCQTQFHQDFVVFLIIASRLLITVVCFPTKITPPTKATPQ